MKKLVLAFVCCCIAMLASSQRGYWQQELQYKISVKLNDQDHSLDAFETLVYTNHSPDTLHFIWFHLWPNAFKNDRTAFSEQMLENGDTRFYFGGKDYRGYVNRLDFRVNEVTAKTEDHPQDIDVVKLLLPKPLLPGESITITTPFHVQLPEISSRGGHVGQSYQVTQWYPKPAVYDQRGWHPMPYLDQGEFYSEFGSFDVEITVPSNYVVAATGDLLDAEEKKWLETRKESVAKPVAKKKPQQWGAKKITEKDLFPPSSVETKTLHYHQDRIHDFAWFTDKRYLVRRGEMTLSSGKKVELYSFFPPWQKQNWDKSLDGLKDAVQKRSDWLGEYPYSTISIVQGYSTGGMEYPTLAIIRGLENPTDLQMTIEHEVGHNWFYGILGNNERDHMWMDEGMNTYYDDRYRQERYPAAKSKSGGLWKDLEEDKMDRIIYKTLVAQHLDQPISTSSVDFTDINYNYIGYTKTADWMKSLELSLGQNKFDSCMRTYFSTWQFKHPYPEDFKTLIDSVSNRNNDSVFLKLYETGDLQPSSKKKWKIAPFVKLNEDSNHTRYLFLAPALGYNTYDGVMVGGFIHNYTLPTTPLQFFIAPMYATKSKDLTGMARVSYTLFPQNVFQNIELAVTGARFNQNAYTDSAGKTLFLNYGRLVPQAKLVFKKRNPRSTITHAIQLKLFLLKDQSLLFQEDTVLHRETVSKKNNYATIGSLRYVVDNQRELYPYHVEWKFESASDFGRMDLLATYFFNFRKKGGIKMRFYAGKFFYYSSKTETKEFETDRYHLNMTGPKGDEDYTYSNYFLGRNEFDGLPSQQIMERDGFFKVRTDLLSVKVGKTDDWLSALNFTMDIPDRFNPLAILPVKIPVKIFTDIGTFNEVWKKGSTEPRFLYDAGLQVSLFQNMLNIYVPLLYSNVYKDYFTSHPNNNFWQKISFSIDFQNARLRKLLNLPAW